MVKSISVNNYTCSELRLKAQELGSLGSRFSCNEKLKQKRMYLW